MDSISPLMTPKMTKIGRPKFKKKLGSIFPSLGGFYSQKNPPPQKKSEAVRLSSKSRHTDDDVMCSPRPYPLPVPILATDFLGLFVRAKDGGQVGGKGEFGIGNWLPPLYPPFPRHYFFGVVPREGGIEGGPTMPDLPRPLPHHSTPALQLLL